MNSKNNQVKKYSDTNKLNFKCRDFETELDLNQIPKQCCLYCMYLNTAKLPEEEWRCRMPRREAQRRHFAGLTKKQKVLT